jgi:hypothetical protein
MTDTSHDSPRPGEMADGQLDKLLRVGSASLLDHIAATSDPSRHLADITGRDDQKMVVERHVGVVAKFRNAAGSIFHPARGRARNLDNQQSASLGRNLSDVERTSRRTPRNRLYRLSRLSWSERLEAAWAGWRDGRNGIPELTQESAVGPVFSLTPAYSMKLRYQVEEAASRCRAQLFRGNSELLVEIFCAANAIVDNYESATLSVSHKDRLTTAMIAWAAQVQAQGARVGVVVAHANQRLEHYLASVIRHHPELRAASQLNPADWWRTGISLDPPWPGPLELLRHMGIAHGSFDPHQGGRTDDRQEDGLVRALRIVNLD